MRHARLQNGYRDFPRQAVEDTKLIQRMLKSGLSLDDVRNLWPCLTAEGEFDGCEAARARLAYHVSRLEREIERDQLVLQHLRERQRLMTPR